MATLSIIIPVYNEKDTLRDVLAAVEKSGAGAVRKEIIIVDDGSTDGTQEILESLEKENKYKIYRHGKNKGKGAALKSGLALATGDFAVIQDADLEYDPRDYAALLEPVLSGEADAVFGSRNLGQNNIPFSAVYFYGGRFTTAIFNLLFGTKFTDIHTCYKLFPARLIPELLRLPGDGFTFDAVELTCALASAGEVREAPIRYRARGRRQGKKLNWRDGYRCLAAMARILFRPSPPLGPALRTSLALTLLLVWTAAGLAVLRFGPGPVLGSWEAFLKSPIFQYYYTIAFGWIAILERNKLIFPFIAAIFAPAVALARFSRRLPLNRRILRVISPTLAAFSVLVAAVLLSYQ